MLTQKFASVISTKLPQVSLANLQINVPLWELEINTKDCGNPNPDLKFNFQLSWVENTPAIDRGISYKCHNSQFMWKSERAA